MAKFKFGSPRYFTGKRAVWNGQKARLTFEGLSSDARVLENTPSLLGLYAFLARPLP